MAKLTKAKAKMYYELYKKSTCTRLEEVYTSFSRAKAKAYNDCVQRWFNRDADMFKIVTHCQQNFTFGYTARDTDGKTVFVLETYCNTYIVPLDDIQ